MSAPMSTETTSSATAPPPQPPPPTQEASSSSLEKQQKAAAAKAKKKQKEKAKKKAKKASRKNAPKTKVVVRRLPPNLPEDVFMNAVKRWTSDEVVDYKFYVPGKLSQRYLSGRLMRLVYSVMTDVNNLKQRKRKCLFACLLPYEVDGSSYCISPRL